eukprot:ctg_1755.g501
MEQLPGWSRRQPTIRYRIQGRQERHTVDSAQVRKRSSRHDHCEGAVGTGHASLPASPHWQRFGKYRERFRGKRVYVDPDVPPVWAVQVARALRAYGAVPQPYFDASLYAMVTHREGNAKGRIMEQARRWRVHVLSLTEARVQRWVRIGLETGGRAEGCREDQGAVVDVDAASGLSRRARAAFRDPWQDADTAMRLREHGVPRLSGPAIVVLDANVSAAERYAPFWREYRPEGDAPTSGKTTALPPYPRWHWPAAVTAAGTGEEPVRQRPPTTPAPAPASPADIWNAPWHHPGLCELCHTRFADYAAHVESVAHVHTARRRPWQAVDALIASVWRQRWHEQTPLARAYLETCTVSPVTSALGSSLASSAEPEVPVSTDVGS